MTVTVTQPSINVREKLAELDKPTGIAGEAMLRAETPQEQQALIGVGRRNLLINSGFAVSQRGDYTSATSGVNNTFYLDRWAFNRAGSGSAGTIQDMGGSVKITATASYTGMIRIVQQIEDAGLYKAIAGQSATISAWVKSNSPNARLQVWQNAWKGVAVHYTGNGEWQYLSLTFTLEDIEGNPDGSLIYHAGIDGYNSADVAIANGEYFEIKQPQLELGKVATPFEHRSYGEELALCQRYYERWSGVGHYGSGFFEATGYGKYFFPFKAVKRATPTVTLSNTDWRAYWTGSTAQATSRGSQNISLESALLWVNGGGSGTDGYATTLLGNASDCFVEVDAEL